MTQSVTIQGLREVTRQLSLMLPDTLDKFCPKYGGLELDDAIKEAGLGGDEMMLGFQRICMIYPKSVIVADQGVILIKGMFRRESTYTLFTFDEVRSAGASFDAYCMIKGSDLSLVDWSEGWRQADLDTTRLETMPVFAREAECFRAKLAAIKAEMWRRHVRERNQELSLLARLHGVVFSDPSMTAALSR